MTDTTNDEQSRYAWARRPTASNDAEPDVPQGYGEPEGQLEPEEHDAPPHSAPRDEEQTSVTRPLTGGSYPTAPQNQTPQNQTPEGRSPYAPPPQGWADPRDGYPAAAPALAPVAAPAAFGAAPTPAAPPQGPLPSAPGQAGPGQGAPGQDGSGYPGLAFGYPGVDPVTGSGPAGPPGPYPPVPPQRDPRRPGWGGVVGIGVGAALLSALLTAGLLNATDNNDSTTSTAATTSSAAAVPGPVKSSTVSNPDWAAVAKAVEPSVVSVQVTSQTESGEGSGVVLNKSGEIVTNNHVVSGVSEGGSVTVILNDGRSYQATVVGTDPQTDLAVIKLKNPPADLTPATLGTSSSVTVGDSVMAVGNPLGLAGTVTTGIVSATDRPTTTTASESQDSQDPFGQGGSGQTSSDDVVITNAIQTDAAVNPGNSGGALVDVQGRVIGIPSSIASLGTSSSSSQSGSIGLGFAIPINEVKTVAAQLAKGEKVKHSYLGVSLSEATVTVGGAQREAAKIAKIDSGTPADKAGLKVGDAVIAVDGEAVNSYISLVGQLREREPGQSVKLTLVRDGKAQDISVTLGTKPATAG